MSINKNNQTAGRDSNLASNRTSNPVPCRYYRGGKMRYLLFIFTLFTSLVYAETPHIDLDIIIEIESNWNETAINKKSGATGLTQITIPALTDFNRTCKENYTMEDMKDPQKAMRVGYTYINEIIPKYLRAFKYEDTIQNRLIAYNLGIGRVKQWRKVIETVNYIKKYKRLKGVK